MAVEGTPGGASLIDDILDRVLDKGIVVDAWVRGSRAGIDLTTVEARLVVVDSIQMRLRYAKRIGITASVARPDESEDPPTAAGVPSPPKPIPPTLSGGAAAVPAREEDPPEGPPAPAGPGSAT